LAILYVDKHASDDIRISHHVYDELALIAPDDKVVEAATLLRAAFEHGYRMVFPDCSVIDIIEIGAGKNWEEAGKDANIIEIYNVV
jgi:hypothetical protein